MMLRLVGCIFLIFLIGSGNGVTRFVKENGRIVAKKQISEEETQVTSDVDFYNGGHMNCKSKFDDILLPIINADIPRKVERDLHTIFEAQGGTQAVQSTLEAHIEEIGMSADKTWPLWGQLGNTWRATGDVSIALQCFRKALSLNDHDPDILLNVSVVLYNLGYFADALVFVEGGLEAAPYGVLHHLTHGTVLQALSRDQEAIEAYETALSIQPEYEPVKQRLYHLKNGSFIDITLQKQLYQVFNVGSSVLTVLFFGFGIFFWICRKYKKKNLDDVADSIENCEESSKDKKKKK
eukprot:TRINITY_DN775967_c0_g1_i1.p1 TRINITY_DN775967_c0_g1~~TRINITY_DN775967_c0_g1_i1.p1  ORF type:complete len:294 (-),score=70.84 TRINITY_DN775967_c0_g1_i1:148-1029(-)